MSYENLDYDFIGFTYNGLHSIRDLGIYRTSNGDRYEESWLPTLKDKTASVDGQIGQYYLGTSIEEKVIPISFAFDNLSEEQFRLMRQAFSGDGIHDLVFDESPYKVYSAKVAGAASIKYLCFENNGKRVYKGDGNLQFTCFYPYAHTPKDVKRIGTQVCISYTGYSQEDGTTIYKPSVSDAIFGCGLVLKRDEELELNFAAEPISEDIPGTDYKKITAIKATFPDVISETKPKDLTLYGSVGYCPYWLYSTIATLTDGTKMEATPEMASNNTYFYSGEKAKSVNAYSICVYSNKYQWAAASRLPLHKVDRIPQKGIGDIDGNFIMTLSGLDAGTYKLTWGDLYFENAEVLTGNSSITWDSKIGLLYNDKKEIIPHKGHTTGVVQYGKDPVLSKWNKDEGKWEKIEGFNYTIDYDYWYY